MSPGALDLLCYINPDEIVKYGIPYLRQELEGNFINEMKLKFNGFWSYFMKTWVDGLYSVDLWNIYRFKDRFDELQNRTNNPLERFNRTLKEQFIHEKHPSMAVFVDKIKKLSINIVQRLDDIKEKKEIVPQRNPMMYLEIPKSYADFKAKSKR